MNRALINSARTCGLAFILMITGIVSATDIVTYYHVDQLGSPKYATDDTGALKWKEQYKPYGQRRLKEADSVNPQTGIANDNGWAEKIWYTGKEEELGMDINYFGARWYDPQLGRFLARDPVGFQNGNVHSFNRYTYVNNNPYKYVDPDGEFAQLIWGGIGGAAFDVALQGIAIATGTQDEFSWGQLATSTLVGAATGGLSVAAKATSVKRAVDGGKATKGAKPVISKQKQAGHIPGTPQNANRVKQGKATSSFFGEKSGERLTQQAFEKGKPVPKRPGVREHDFGVSTGTGPNGGMQTKVRVHQDSKGRIHGHPSGPERF